MGLLVSLRQRSSLPDTFREAFEGKQDRLVEKDTTDYSGLLVKLQAKGVITDRHKRHIHSIFFYFYHVFFLLLLRFMFMFIIICLFLYGSCSGSGRFGCVLISSWRSGYAGVLVCWPSYLVVDFRRQPVVIWLQ